MIEDHKLLNYALTDKPLKRLHHLNSNKTISSKVVMRFGYWWAMSAPLLTDITNDHGLSVALCLFENSVFRCYCRMISVDYVFFVLKVILHNVQFH